MAFLSLLLRPAAEHNQQDRRQQQQAARGNASGIREKKKKKLSDFDPFRSRFIGSASLFFAIKSLDPTFERTRLVGRTRGSPRTGVLSRGHTFTGELVFVSQKCVRYVCVVKSCLLQSCARTLSKPTSPVATRTSFKFQTRTHTKSACERPGRRALVLF